jgi:HEAT repeat protein
LSDLTDIHDRTFSKASDERRKAARQLGALFEVFPERKQALEDLLKLCSDDEEEVREEAINSLKTVFPNVPEKELVWERFVNLTAYPVERIFKAAVNALGTVFPLMPDKRRAWEDLIELINSKSSLEDVRKGIIHLLPDVISEFSDKEKAWNDLLEMTGSADPYVREKAASVLKMVFPELPDEKKGDAWEDLLELAGKAGDIQVRRQAADTLVNLFPYLEDKDTTWKELMELTENEDEYVQKTASDTLIKVFPYVSDKSQAYSDLVNLAEKKDDYVLRKVAETLASIYLHFYEDRKINETKTEASGEDLEEGSEEHIQKDVSEEYVQKEAEEPFAGAYPGSPDKEIVKELLRLKSDPDPQIKRGAIESLLALYLNKSEKTKEIWRELLKLTGDTDTGVRKGAAELLSHVFPAVEEKSAVFDDLVRLTEGQDARLRKRAAELLAAAFTALEEKQKAWDDLLRLTSSEDREVRKGAVLALLSGYPEVPDKTKVWNDLIGLSAHNDIFVQRAVTRALGPAFFDVPDKTLAWRDLQELINNPYIYVRKYALRSLGRASLWRSLRAENEATYLFGLKEAVKYLKESAETSTGILMPEFYSPFYEALLQILFNERSSRLESERYLTELSSGLGELKENQKLLEILEEFAGLLRAAGDLNPKDLPARKKLLETGIGAFDRYSGFFESVEEDAILAKKPSKKEYKNAGKAVTEQQLKQVLSGIRYKARTACYKTKGTPAEKIACTVNQKVRTWNFQDLERDGKKLDMQLDSLLNLVETQIPCIPENTTILEKLEGIGKEKDLLERYRQLSRFIGLIPKAKL